LVADAERRSVGHGRLRGAGPSSKTNKDRVARYKERAEVFARGDELAAPAACARSGAEGARKAPKPIEVRKRLIELLEDEHVEVVHSKAIESLDKLLAQGPARLERRRSPASFYGPAGARGRAVRQAARRSGDQPRCGRC
jgi:hypothetical protein